MLCYVMLLCYRSCILRFYLFCLSVQKKGVHIVAVGIGGGIKVDELKRIAGENVIMVKNFDELSDHLKFIETFVCSKLHANSDFLASTTPTDRLPTTYPQPADYLLTTYRPPSDNQQKTCRLPTDHLPTTYGPPTDHLPTTYRAPTGPLPTTYQPPTDNQPTTY